MNSVARGIERARASVNAQAGKFLPDLCDLISLGTQSDGHSGSTEKPTTLATNVPCRYDEVAGTGNQVVAGEVSYQATHKLTFGASSATMAISPKYQIKVLARGDKPVMYFEQPVREKGSMAVFVRCLAKFTVGYRQPANV